MNHRLQRMLTSILDAAPNPYAAIFALRLLMSPKAVRDEWYRVGYRFPWQQEDVHPFRTERERWAYSSGKDTAQWLTLCQTETLHSPRR